MSDTPPSKPFSAGPGSTGIVGSRPVPSRQAASVPASIRPASSSGATAWLFPGQGSQFVGMGHDLLARFPPARAALERASGFAGVDLAALVTRGPDDVLTRTDNLQPALTAVTAACCLFLRQQGLRPDFVAGHSLGEYAALFAAGVISLDDALRLTVARGQIMHQVAETIDGGMLAVKGLPAEQIDAALRGRNENVTIANHNAPAQIAVCGPRALLPDAAAALVEAGGQVVPLNVSGPWHSPLLAPAADRFAEFLDRTEFLDADVPIAMNATGTIERSAAAIRAAMRRQICSPVQWHTMMLALRDAGAKQFIEVGPKKVLRGLLRHIPELAEAEAVNFDGPRALRFVQRLMETPKGHEAPVRAAS